MNFELFHRLRDLVRLRRAVAMADTAHATDGERYYVMPATDGKLIVTDRKNFRILRRKHYIHRDATVRDLAAECFYCTPYRDGKGAMPPDVISSRRRIFLAWSRATRRLLREQKKKGRQ